MSDSVKDVLLRQLVVASSPEEIELIERKLTVCDGVIGETN